VALNWPAAKFRQVFGAALVAASSDVERPHLCAVFVERANSTVRVAGTDGHWLLTWKEVEGETDEEGRQLDRSPFTCLIPRRVVESFLAATKKHQELERVLLTCTETPYQLATIFDVCKNEFLPQPEAFPAIDKVIPSTVAPTCSSISVAAGMLARVAKAFTIATGDPSFPVHWQFSGDNLSPLVCTSPVRPELLAVVMPMRTDSANAVPDKPVADSGMAAPEAAE
jgi:hypothetical protein